MTSAKAKEMSFGESMFKRLFKHKEVESQVFRLRTQYRMHDEIQRFPNRYFYAKLLRNVRTLFLSTPNPTSCRSK